MRKMLYWGLQLSWGLPQNLIGLVLFLLNRKNPCFLYHGAIVCQWNRKKDCMGMGMFIFLSQWEQMDIKKLERSFILRHEYGHTIQSMILGPFYLFVIGIPSLVWNRIFYSKLSEKKNNYFSFYTEKTANYLVEKFVFNEGEKL